MMTSKLHISSAAHLSIINSEDTDLDSMITTFNTAVTETASEILGKHHHQKKQQLGHWKKFLICATEGENWERNGLNLKIWEIQGYEQHQEVHEKEKKKRKNWTGQQCSETEENLRKNNSKRAYQLMKDLTTLKLRKATTVQDRSGKCLIEDWEILNRWTEYCTELYNHMANGDPSVLSCPQTHTEYDHPIVCKEVEAAVQSLKKGKSEGVDNFPRG